MKPVVSRTCIVAAFWAFQLIHPPHLFADDKIGRLDPKSFRGVLNGVDTSTYDLNLSSTLDKMIQQGTDAAIDDSYILNRLRMERDLEQPHFGPNDVEPSAIRGTAEKALGIQATQNMLQLIRQSELKEVYRTASRALKTFQGYFRYSLQSDGQSLQVSKARKGRKLLEFNVELNAHHGIDPQLRITDSIRLRYDYTAKKPMLEFEVNF